MNVKTKVSYEANPNGNLWLKDEGGFGQKMLAKMGWSEGKGLGRNNQGITKAITVSKKIDNRGVGCSKQWAEEGNAQMDAFADVLASLNSQNESTASEVTANENETEQTVGLEETSRNSKFRLHYSKFTRGKDLSRYSETALKCIVGPRGISSKRKKEVVETSNGKETRDDSVRYISSVVNMADYFKQKMEAKMNSLKSSSSAPQLHDREDADSEDEATARPSFGGGGNGFMSPNSFADHFKPTFFLGANCQTTPDDAEKDDASRPAFFIGDTSEKGEGGLSCEDMPAPDDPLETRKRKKKSKKRKREDQDGGSDDSTSRTEKPSKEESTGLEASQPSFEVRDAEEEAVEASPVVEMADTTKKRKKKSKKRKREDQDGGSDDCTSDKKKRLEEASISPELSQPLFEVGDAEEEAGEIVEASPDVEMADTTKKRKKKSKRKREDQDGGSDDCTSGKKKQSEEEAVQPSFEVGDSAEGVEASPEDEAADTTTRRKKKNKKRNRDEVEEEHTDAHSSKSKKKLKREIAKLEEESGSTLDVGRDEGEVEQTEPREEEGGAAGGKVGKKKKKSKRRRPDRPSSPKTETSDVAALSSRTTPLTTSEQIALLENKGVLESLDTTVFSSSNLGSVLGYKYYNYKPSPP